MNLTSRDDVTRLLASLNANNEEAGEALLGLVYEELRNLARYYMRQERADHTLQTTALVHEAYIRLLGEEDTAWENRAHYFRVAARAMRRVLIDHARSKSSRKKGAGWSRETLEKAVVTIGMPLDDLLSLDSALDRLSELDPSLAQVIELRFFGGLTIEDTALVMDVSAWKVKNDWRIARAWLKKEL